MQQIRQEYQGQVERASQQQVSNSKTISALVSKVIHKIVTKQYENEEGPDVEAYIIGMVQASVVKMQTNQPALASDSKSTKNVTL